jgi:hypothetical protein
MPIIITLSITIFLLILFLIALSSSRKIDSSQKNAVLKQLDDIKYSMSTHNPSANRDGIVRLDALLSKSLQLKNKNSLNCGENLKRSKIFIGKSLNEKIWYYHKLRNQIVHDNIEIEDDDALQSYKVYSQVINKLLK